MQPLLQPLMDEVGGRFRVPMYMQGERCGQGLAEDSHVATCAARKVSGGEALLAELSPPGSVG